MRQINDGWEIVSRRTNNPIRHLLSMLFQIMLIFPEAVPYYSTVTWTVRQTATGIVCKVTARSEQEAMEKIALGIFDKD